MSKAVLIIPVEVVSTSSGLGGLIVLGLIIYFFASAIFGPKTDNFAVSDIGKEVSDTYDFGSNEVKTLHHFTGRYHNPNLADYDSDTLWTAYPIEGALVARYWESNFSSQYLVFNRSGLTLTTSPTGSNPPYRSFRDPWPGHLVSDLSQSLATHLPQANITTTGGEGSYRLTISNGAIRSGRCIIDSPKLFNWTTGLETINQVGYFATYNYAVLQLWDFECNEIVRYDPKGVIRMAVATNDGGILFAEQVNGKDRSSEYYIRYLNP